MLVYDATSPRATQQAERIRPLLPVGTPVVPVADLPDAGTLSLHAPDVADTIAWVAVDGSVYRSHHALGHALTVCGGKTSAWGWAIRTPGVGAVVAQAWSLRPT